MERQGVLRQVGREWLVALLSFALISAPFGCQIQSGILDPNDSDGGPNVDRNSVGLFVNPNLVDPLMVAGRSAEGDEVFIYGARGLGGVVQRVDTILLRAKGGGQAFIRFEQGRPVFAQAVDGSYVRLTYTDVSTLRLAATADVFVASEQRTETFNVDIDLQRAAAEIAQRIQEATGRTVQVPETPTAGTEKALHRSQSTVIIDFTIAPLVAFTQLILIVIGQVIVSVAVAAAFVIEATVLAVFAPFFVLAGLLDPSVRVEVAPLFDVFITLPPEPQITIEL